MARKPRVELPGAFYHVITRGNDRQAIFRSDTDRRHYLERLEHYRRRDAFTIYAYVLMTNHVHLLLALARSPLSKIMQGLQSAYARYFNARYQKAGHLFQGRYKAILCDRDAYLLDLVRYIHLNPARVRDAMDPLRYAWSSHGAYMGEPSPVSVDTSLVLRQFATRMAEARRAYLAFLESGMGDGHQAQYYDASDPRFLGGQEFIRGVADRVSADREIGRPPAVSLDLLVQAVAHAHRIEPDQLVIPARRGRWTPPRAMLVYLAREWCRLGFKELGHRLHRDPSTLSRLCIHYANGRDPRAEARIAAWLQRNAQMHA